MKLQEIIRQVYFEPSLIHPAGHAAIRNLLEQRIGNIKAERPPGDDGCGGKVELPQMDIQGNVAIIPIGGVIGQKLSPFERGAGCVDVSDIERDIDDAEKNDAVESILYDMDTPGGMVQGTPELANRMAAVVKPNYAFTNGQISSAGYWLAASAGGIFATPTANIGSIGVFLPWVDQSEAFKQAGLSVEVISSGAYKGIGMPGTSLTDVQRAHLQDQINNVFEMFKAHVRENRGDIDDDTMQGQTFMAAEALERGLIDQMVQSKAELLGYLIG